MSTKAPAKAPSTPRKATLEERRALWTSEYRKSAETEEGARRQRDAAIVNMFRSLPDSVTTEKKTATGTTRTTKPVSDNQRAKDTLSALAVGIDESGATRDVWALKPQRVVQIVKAYTRAETMTMLRPSDDGSLSPMLASEEGVALVTALTTAAKGNALGDKGADALAEVTSKSLAQTAPQDVVKAAEEATREALAKASEAAKADKVAAAAKVTQDAEARPAAKVAGALDSLEAALTAVAKDLDPQQKAMLLQRLESLALHLK